MATQSLTFGGVSSATYGILISGEGIFNAPKRAVDVIQIPGKNGALAIDRGYYENITITYPAFYYRSDMANFSGDLATFRNAMISQTGYQTLTDTIHATEYRKAMFVDGIEFDPIKYNTGAHFKLTFNCKPQRYLVSGDSAVTFTADGTITNPTLCDSKPIITVTGNGQLTVGGVTMTIGGTSTTIIDSELMDCYDLNGSKNSDVVFSGYDFPTLAPGSNAITIGTGITQVDVVPKWWRL